MGRERWAGVVGDSGGQTRVVTDCPGLVHDSLYLWRTIFPDGLETIIVSTSVRHLRQKLDRYQIANEAEILWDTFPLSQYIQRTGVWF